MPRRRLATLCTAALLTILAACSTTSATTDANTTTSTSSTVAPATTTTSPPTTTTTAAPMPCALSMKRPLTEEYIRRPGVDRSLLSLDVYLLDPSCGVRPVVVWIHGGGWSSGDKAIEIAGKVALAVANGWVLVSINYRLSTDDVMVRWPDHGNDAAAAVGFVLDHAAEFRIDPAHIALMGHSAGGHIASMLAVDPYLLTNVGYRRENLSCVVGLDTQGYDLLAPGDATDGWIPFYVQRAFGPTREDLERASPSYMLRQVPGRVAEFLIVTRGGPYRRQIANDFALQLRLNGTRALVLDAGAYEHAEVNLRLGDPTDSEVTPVVERFLRNCLSRGT